MKIKEITNLIKGELIAGDYESEINAIEQDTRLIQKGDTFIAFSGESSDGNKYVDVAIEKGATNVICNLPSIDLKGKECNVIYVEDSLFALHEIIKYKLANSNTKVIGVTGSVGKTSTRELISEIVKEKYTVFKTEKNYNGMRGLPLTCSKIDNEEVAIIEMGMDGENQINQLSKIVKPEIGVITNIGSSHIGKLKSRENILKAKMEILEGIKENGYLVINIDNDMLNTAFETWDYNTIASQKNISLVTVGINNDKALFNATNVHEYIDYTTFNCSIANVNIQFRINSIGTHNILNALIAIAVGKILELTTEEIQAGLDNLRSTERRLQKIELDKITLYDDSYNASYESVKAAIDVVSKRKVVGRSIYILGDVLELGEFSQRYHRKIGRKLAKAKVDVLVTIGKESLHINEELSEKEITYTQYHYNNVDDFLENIIEFEENDTILLKASNGMKFIKIADYLKEKYKRIDEVEQ